MDRENDIIKDAYYLVNLFNINGNKVTQIHIQKLMFLFEAYYMNMKNTDRLYDCEFNAWNFGPVATQLYKVFKKYGKDEIVLTREEEKIGNSISQEKKELIQDLYKAFGSFSAKDLVKFTHMEGSPWKEIWDTKKYDVIPKEKMKSWFEKYVVK